MEIIRTNSRGVADLGSLVSRDFNHPNLARILLSPGYLLTEVMDAPDDEFSSKSDRNAAIAIASIFTAFQSAGYTALGYRTIAKPLLDWLTK